MFSAADLFSGVIVATVVPFAAEGNLLLDKYSEHVGWLLVNGCRGVATNGSLGEYSSLSTAERRDGVKVAAEHKADDFVIVSGIASPSGHESRQHAEDAVALG